MVREKVTTFGGLSLMRLADRPFFVSEWDHAWPDPFRAESSLWYAAICALQGWGGATIHTYRYSTWEPKDSIGGGAQTINSITYRNHFDSFNDPAKFGLFYQAALIHRRGDVQESDHQLNVCIPSDDEWLLKQAADMRVLDQAAEQQKVAIVFDWMAPQAGQNIAPDETLPTSAPGMVESDTSEIGRNIEAGYGWINTPRTQAAYGFLAEAGKIELNDLTLKINSDFATVALSSLTDEPISLSCSMLLSAVGRSDNTGAEYSEDGKRQLNFGHEPILIEVIEGQLAVRTERTNLKVWVISDKGEAVTRLPTEYNDGWLRFKIGPQPSWNPSTMFYLIRI